MNPELAEVLRVFERGENTAPSDHSCDVYDAFRLIIEADVYFVMFKRFGGNDLYQHVVYSNGLMGMSGWPSRADVQFAISSD